MQLKSGIVLHKICSNSLIYSSVIVRRNTRWTVAAICFLLPLLSPLHFNLTASQLVQYLSENLGLNCKYNGSKSHLLWFAFDLLDDNRKLNIIPSKERCLDWCIPNGVGFQANPLLIVISTRRKDSKSTDK